MVPTVRELDNEMRLIVIFEFFESTVASVAEGHCEHMLRLNIFFFLLQCWILH